MKIDIVYEEESIKKCQLYNFEFQNRYVSYDYAILVNFNLRTGGITTGIEAEFFVSPSILPHLVGVNLSSSKQWENMNYCKNDIFTDIFGFPFPGIYQKIDYRYIGSRYYNLFTFTVFDDYPIIDHYWKVVLNPYYWWLTHGI